MEIYTWKKGKTLGRVPISPALCLTVWSSCLIGLKRQKTEFRVTRVAGKNKRHKVPISGMTAMTPLPILQLL